MIRARFVVVPLVLFGPFAGYAAAITVSDALDERESRRREREWEQRVAPAAEAVGRISVDGMTPCASRHPAENACLTGTVEVKRAHAAIEAALREAGATDVRSRCRDLRDRSVCFTDSRLHGNDVHLTVAHVMVGGKPTRTVEATFVATPHVDV